MELKFFTPNLDTRIITSAKLSLSFFSLTLQFSCAVCSEEVATSPTLYIINNPAENLNVEEKIEVVRFRVPLVEWKNKGASD